MISRNILAVGAYERDNFGDILFLLILRMAFPDDNIIPGSIIFSELNEEQGYITIPYDFVLSNFKVDAVWVVGGEIGAVDINSALAMTLPRKQYEIYQDIVVQKKDQSSLEVALSINYKNSLAYVPNMDIYKKNKNTNLIINSVGISNDFEKPALKNVLKNAKQISVREKASAELCSKMGIDVEVVPDVVHSIVSMYKPNNLDSGLVFQINEATFNDLGTESILKSISEVYFKNNFSKVTLIAAGIANNHDSIKSIEEMEKKLKKIGINAELERSRDPLKTVDVIAGASLVVSTSLHVRIVASAYNVRRISLKNKKVTNYVENWDKEFPYDIAIDSLVEASELAMATDLEINKIKTKTLSDKAFTNLKKLHNQIIVSNDHNLPTTTELIKYYINNTFSNNLKTLHKTSFENQKQSEKLEKLEIKLQRLTDEVESTSRKNYELNNELESIKKSKGWRMVLFVRKIKSYIKAITLRYT